MADEPLLPAVPVALERVELRRNARAALWPVGWPFAFGVVIGVVRDRDVVTFAIFGSAAVLGFVLHRRARLVLDDAGVTVRYVRDRRLAWEQVLRFERVRSGGMFGVRIRLADGGNIAAAAPCDGWFTPSRRQVAALEAYRLAAMQRTVR